MRDRKNITVKLAEREKERKQKIERICEICLQQTLDKKWTWTLVHGVRSYSCYESPEVVGKVVRVRRCSSGGGISIALWRGTTEVYTTTLHTSTALQLIQELECTLDNVLEDMTIMLDDLGKTPHDRPKAPAGRIIVEGDEPEDPKARTLLQVYQDILLCRPIVFLAGTLVGVFLYHIVINWMFTLIGR